MSHAHPFSVAVCLLLLSGCSAGDKWDGFNLDTGLGVGLPMVGVEANAHCKVSLGKFNPEGVADAKPVDPVDVARADARLELRAEGQGGLGGDED